jgi:hypothetical protein
MMKIGKPVAALLWCFILILPAWAHHSFAAEYDRDKPITVTGVITQIEWANPHSHWYLDVKDAKGNVANWKFEGYAPNILYRAGFRKDVTIKVGDTITVMGWQARDGTNWAQGREMTLSDGRKVYCGPNGGAGATTPEPPADASKGKP